MYCSDVEEDVTPIFVHLLCEHFQVLGDLYLHLKGKGIVNLVDELGDWPVFLEKDPEFYIDSKKTLPYSFVCHSFWVENPT